MNLQLPNQNKPKVELNPKKDKKFDIPRLLGNKKKAKKIRVKVLTYGILTLFLSLIITALFFIVQEYFLTHTFHWQSPVLISIKFETPLVIQRKKELVISPLGKEKMVLVEQAHAQSLEQIPDWQIMPDNVDKKKWAYIVQQPYAKLILHIWKHESNYGRDVVMGSLDQYCRTRGKYNEFGYGGMNDMSCYDTFEASVQAVVTGLSGYKNMDDTMKLCYYNLGIKEESCSYTADWN